jgi:hypothetical protein
MCHVCLRTGNEFGQSLEASSIQRNVLGELPRDVQHAASTLGAGLQAAGATNLDITARGCDINSPVHRGTKPGLVRMNSEHRMDAKHPGEKS